MYSIKKITQQSRWLNSLITVLVCVSMMLGTMAATPVTVKAEGENPPAGGTPAVNNPETAVPQNFRQIVVKFKEGSQVRLRDNGLTSLSGADLAPAQNILNGLDVRRLFSSNEAELDQERDLTRRTTGELAPDLNQYYMIQLGEDKDLAAAQKLVQDLLALDSVETAYLEPSYAPASVSTTPSFTDQQDYLDLAANGGMGASDFSAADPFDPPNGTGWGTSGGTGWGVRVIDVEWGWLMEHEDLALTSKSLLAGPNASQVDYINHGTNVLGVVAAKKNLVETDYVGVTGVAPDTELKLIAINNTRPIADAVNLAIQNARPGDVILLPIQAQDKTTTGPQPVCPVGCDCSQIGYVPVEFYQANYDVIQAATKKGVIVVEAAGNGLMNLDDSRYDGKFDRKKRDSGAIIVGAGDKINHAPMCFTNYGDRLDLQGWGESVVTTGGAGAGKGDLVNPDDPTGADPKRYYTNSFGGTSAAAAMVAGAVSSLQGIANQRGFYLNPSQMRKALVESGTAQPDGTLEIGPLPDLVNAIATKISNLIYPVSGKVIRGLRPTIRWGETQGASQYRIQVSSGSTFQSLTYDQYVTIAEFRFPSDLTKNITYFWRVSAFINGAWTDWSITNSFMPFAGHVDVPTSLTPKAGYYSFGTEPTFTWKIPKGTNDGYEIQVSKNYNFNPLDPSTIDEIADCTPNADNEKIMECTLSTSLDVNTSYYWRIRPFVGAFDPTNPDSAPSDTPDVSYGAWSDRRVIRVAPSVPVPLIAPVDGVHLDIYRPTFQWTEVAGASAYQLEVARSAKYSGTILRVTINKKSGETKPATTYTPTKDLKAASQLWWRVRTLGSIGWSQWSGYKTKDGPEGDNRSFYTPDPKLIPSVSAPAASYLIQLPQDTVTLSWNTPKKGAVTGYQLQVASDAAFSALLVDQTQAGRSYVLPVSLLAPDTAYYWRVRATFSGGSTGIWSLVYMLYTSPLQPTGLIAPVGGVMAVSMNPTLSWNPAPAATAYDVQMGLENLYQTSKGKFKKVFLQKRVSGTPYDVPTTLPRPKYNKDGDPYNNIMMWRVASVGKYGPSRYTAFATFELPDPPFAPSLSSPTNAATLTSFYPTLKWNQPASKQDTQVPVGYQLQVSPDLGFGAGTKTVDGIGEKQFEISSAVDPVSGLTWDMLLLPISGTYYWHVRAINADGIYSPWSATFRFTTPPMFKGVVKDAMTGAVLPNFSFVLNNVSTEVKSAVDGSYVLRAIPVGYSSLGVTGPGYIPQQFNIKGEAGNNYVQDFWPVSFPAVGQVRIVVTWQSIPKDLDAHLWMPTNNKFHIYKNNLGDLTALPYAKLEKTVDTGFGPEVITLAQVINGTKTSDQYDFAVNMPDDVMPGTVMPLAAARVTVYYGSSFVETVVMPTTGSGHWWNVFSLRRDTTKDTIIVTQKNTLSDSNPAPY
jgi:hypothetical protein